MSKKSGNSKSISDLERAFTNAIDTNSSSLTKLRISELEEENAKLKDLVKVLMESQSAGLTRLDPIDEEYICEMEVAKIKSRVLNNNGELSLDDVKKLETLWKVKKSIKDDKLNNKNIQFKSELPDNLTREQVKQIAELDEDLEDSGE